MRWRELDLRRARPIAAPFYLSFRQQTHSRRGRKTFVSLQQIGNAPNLNK